MTFNNRVYIQRKITKRTKLFFLLNNVWENIRGHDKKENKKKNTTDHRDKIDNKKRYTKKPRTRILKEVINIFERQE